MHTDFNELDNPRGAMIDDLYDNHLKKGLSKTEVVELLGKPYQEILRKNREQSVFTSAHGQGASNQVSAMPVSLDTVLLYPIGWYSGFRIDPDFLAIKLNGSGMVDSYWSEQH